jgi:hypothetical protein
VVSYIDGGGGNMSMTKLENPVRMTEEEANEKFYPNSYVMIHCEMGELGRLISGEVVAYAPLKKKGPLVDYAWDMSDNGSFGEIIINDTKDPLDGGSLLVEYHVFN